MEKQCQDSFAPQVGNIPFMICRQIMREIAEHANRHGCGITVDRSDGEMLVVRLLFARVENVMRT